MISKKREQKMDLKQQLEAEEKRSQEYLTRMKYLQADLENLQKRFNRQMEELERHCNERIILQLLEVQDELEMAIKTAQSDSSSQALIIGVNMTLKKLRKVFEQEGVHPIECEVGKPFNAACHNAVSAAERDDVKACIVTEEVRKGYIMKDKVIRPSIVKVAIGKSKKHMEKEENE
jgi:molecular chaperone GrpE